MEWKNLEKGTCPSCDEVMRQRGGLVVCDFCSFNIGIKKYTDVIKNGWLDKKPIRNKKKKSTKKVVKKINTNDAERLSNLKRMLIKRKISNEEYLAKVATIRT